RPALGWVFLPLPFPQPGQPRRGQHAHDRGRPPLLRRHGPDPASGPVPRDRGYRLPVIQQSYRRVPDRLGFYRVDLLAQDVPFLVVRFVRVGVDTGVSEPPLAPAGPPALARLAVLGFADPRA